MCETISQIPDLAGASILIDVRAVAAILGCSPRHVYRLSDSGRMPRPLRLGGLVRWNLLDIEKWIDSGCPQIGHKQAKEDRNDD